MMKMTKNCRSNVRLPFCRACAVVLFSAVLGACANQTAEGINVVAADGSVKSLTEAEIKQYLLEWQQAKPGIERLTALESDLTFLIAEVSKMSELNDTPEQYAQETKEPDDTVVNGSNVIVATASAPFQEPVIAPPPRAEVEALHTEQKVTADAYAVHLANFLKPTSANFGWYVVQQEYPTLMRNLSPKLKQVSRKNLQLYSLRIGPFDTDIQAQKACNLLKRRNYRCELTTFDGMALSL